MFLNMTDPNIGHVMVLERQVKLHSWTPHGHGWSPLILRSKVTGDLFKTLSLLQLDGKHHQTLAPH